VHTRMDPFPAAPQPPGMTANIGAWSLCNPDPAGSTEFSVRKHVCMTRGTNRNLRARVSRALPWTILETAFSSVLLIVQVVILARLLGPGDFGRAALTQSIVSLVQIISTWGLTEALVRHRSSHTEVLDTAFWASLVLGICGFAVCLALSPLVALSFRGGIDPGFLAVQGLSCITAAAMAVPNAMLVRKMRTRTLATGTLFWRLVTFVTSVVLAWRGFGPWSVIFGTVAGSFAGAAYFWHVHPRWPRLRVSYGDLRRMMRFGLVYWIEMLVRSSVTQSLLILIGFFHGPVGLGLFTFALRIVEQVGFLVFTVASRFGMPVLSEVHRKGGDLVSTFVSGSRILTAAAFPLFVGLASVTPDMVQSIFGARWLPAIPIIQVLCIVWGIAVARTLVPVYLRVIGKQSVNLIMSMLYLAIAIISVVSTAHLTVVAAAVAYTGRALIGTPVGMLLLSRAAGVPVRKQIMPLVGPLIAVTLMAAAVAICRDLMAEAATFARLGVSVLAGVIVYGLAILVFDRPTVKLARSALLQEHRRGRECNV
jgi:teichuronic acid exporter